MKKCFLLLICACSLSHATKYRWDVKLLIDTSGHRVYKMTAQPATIDNLADVTANPRPAKLEMSKNRRADSEKRKVTITAFVIADGHENDGDYHLVLKSVSGNKTLIGEIPDPAGSKLGGFPGLKTDYSKGRKFVEQTIGQPPGSVIPLSHPVKVKITGVVFFDKLAHGNGHADNGVEIHPILSIQAEP